MKPLIRILKWKQDSDLKSINNIFSSLKIGINKIWIWTPEIKKESRLELDPGLHFIGQRRGRHKNVEGERTGLAGMDKKINERC